MRRLMVLLVILVPSVSLAQQLEFEITPTLGYRWGGNLEVAERAFDFEDFDVDLDASGSFGLRLGVDLNPRLQFEAIYNRQAGQLEDRHGLFSEWFVAIDEDNDGVPEDYEIFDRSSILDINATYIHAGLLWHWGKGEDQKYVAGSIGVTRVDPGVNLHTESGLSTSLGAGYKLQLNERLALRFEGRLYWTRLDDGGMGIDYVENPACDIPCTITYGYPSDFVQFEATMGLSVKL